MDVIQKMKVLGPPRLCAFYDSETETWFSQEGTHRLRAAKVLGMVPVMLPVPWTRGKKALTRARFAFQSRGHTFL